MFAGAGLPQLPSITAEAQTYAERMISWPEIGRLPDEEARNALLLPAQAAGASFRPDALAHTVDYTEGYPMERELAYVRALVRLDPVSTPPPTPPKRWA